MTDARNKHTAQERQIAKALGLSDAQLDALLAIRTGRWPGNAAAVLETKGLAFRDRTTGKSGLTETGEAKLKQARKLGF